jgi:hypothetical protein
MSEEKKEGIPKLYKNPSLRDHLLPLFLEALDLAENKEKIRKLDLNDPETRTRLAKVLQGLSITASQIDELFRIVFHKDPTFVKNLASDPTFGCIPITTQKSAKLNREGCKIVEAIGFSQGHEDSETLSDCCKDILASFASLRTNKDKPKGTWKPLKSEIVEIKDNKKRDELIDRILKLPEDDTKGWAVAMRDWVLLFEEVPEQQREDYRTGIGRIYNDLIALVDESGMIAKEKSKITEKYRKRNAFRDTRYEHRQIPESEYKEWKTNWESERDAEISEKTIQSRSETLRIYMSNFLRDRYL